MNSLEDKDFTPEKGIAYQEAHLAKWRTKLKRKVYKDLVQYATKDNDKAETGYEIKRGEDLTVFVRNWQPKK